MMMKLSFVCLCFGFLTYFSIIIDIAATSRDIWCSHTEVKCGSGSQCIPYNWLCDGTSECHDGSDESKQNCVCPPATFSCSTGICTSWSPMYQSTRCANAKCINLKARCDGRKDCSDNSDEQTCKNYVCPENHFKCVTSGACIDLKKRCNGLMNGGSLDCQDGSDEEDCKNYVCPENHFKCVTSGACIDLKNRCDGVHSGHSGSLDCQDGSDEADCKNYVCPENNWQCSSGVCIPSHSRCDGQEDCDDASDENNCDEYVCESSQWRCFGGNTTQCIQELWRCDGYADCQDQSDEQHCQDYDCPSSAFQCKSGTPRCIPKELVCDSDFYSHCADGSDEADCPEFSNDENVSKADESADAQDFTNGVCESGWVNHGNKCYKIASAPFRTYSEAEKKCEEEGSNLLSLKSDTYLSSLEALLSFNHLETIWLSGRRFSAFSPYIWNTGQDMVFSEWKGGEPSDGYSRRGTASVCMLLARDVNSKWQWQITSCDSGNTESAVVCEKTSTQGWVNGMTASVGDLMPSGCKKPAKLKDGAWMCDQEGSVCFANCNPGFKLDLKPNQHPFMQCFQPYPSVHRQDWSDYKQFQCVPDDQYSRPKVQSKPFDRSTPVVLMAGGTHVNIFDPSGLCKKYFRNLGTAFGLKDLSLHYLNQTDQVLLCGGQRKIQNQHDKYEGVKSCSQLVGRTFKHHSDLIEPRFDHFGVFVGDKLWLLGGSRIKQELMTIAPLVQTTFPSVDPVEAAPVKDSSKWGGPKSIETLSILEGSVWSKEPSELEMIMEKGCAVAINNRSIIFIGFVKDSYKEKYVTEFNTVTKRWTQRANMLEPPRERHSCVHIPSEKGGNGKILVAGGKNSGYSWKYKNYDTAEIYDIDANEWKMAGKLFSPRLDGQLVVVGRRILLLGGNDGRRNELSSVEEFHPEGNIWSSLDEKLDSNLHNPRSSLSAITVPRETVGC